MHGAFITLVCFLNCRVCCLVFCRSIFLFRYHNQRTLVCEVITADLLIYTWTSSLGVPF